MADFSIIILTYNEEYNLPACLDSLAGLAAPVFVFDSFSTDGTLDILRARGIPYEQHAFDHYGRQRNRAQEQCPGNPEWVFHLDAGERLTPALVHWLNHEFDPASTVAGYMFSRQTLFMGRWIRYGGHYPNYHLRLFRRAAGRCEDKVYDQHFLVDGPTRHLPPGIDIIDTVADNLHDFTTSHARWAVYEAIETVAAQAGAEPSHVVAEPSHVVAEPSHVVAEPSHVVAEPSHVVAEPCHVVAEPCHVVAKPCHVVAKRRHLSPSLTGTPIQRQRWLKQRLFHRSPLFLRAFSYFLYRYLLRGGFRDGRAGLVFHFLQGCWFRFLVDACIFELQQELRNSNLSLREIVLRKYGERYRALLSEQA